MKRLINKGLSAVMAAVMLMTVLVSAPFTVNADDTEPEFVFERFDSGFDGSITVKLSRYNGSDENVVIPNQVPDDYQDEALRGKDVSIIKEYAFYENQNIKSVTIPDNVNHIAQGAFAGCPNLEEVTIGTSLDLLGDSAFANCPNLSKVTIYSKPSNFSFGDFVFDGSPKVTVHGYHGSKIESTMISNKIPFKGLDHSYGNPVWTWEDDYSAATASFSCSHGDDTETINATITSEVVSYPTVHNDGRIKYTASVPFGDNTYSIQQWETIPKLEHVAKKFPTADSNGNIEYWYNGKYYSDANGVHEITEAETLIPYFTFGTYDKLLKLISYNGNDENVTVPENVPDNYPDQELRGQDFSIIKEEAFKGNSTLKKVVLQNNIGNVSDYVFRNCENLTEVTIGTNLDHIGERCFYNTPKLEKITIYSKDSRFVLHDFAFSGAGNVTVYGYHNTEVERQIKAKNIPFVPIEHNYSEPVWNWSEDNSSATATFNCEFCEDTQTVDATINVKRTEPTHSKEGEIKYTATAVINGQTYTNVKTEPIPISHELRHFPKVPPTQDQNGYIEYWYCPECNKYYSDASGDEDKVIEEKDTILPYFTFEYTYDHFYKLISYNGNDGDVTIPSVIPDIYPVESLRGETVTIINEGAFNGNTDITSVSIPDSIVNIDTDSFRNCANLETVYIGTGLNFLGNTCFSECPKLEKVTICSKKDSFDMHFTAFSLSNNVTVYGYCGTAVQTEMNENNISFKSLGHAYGEPEWSWSEDNSSATAAFTCTHNDDTQTVEAQVTSEVTKQATCLEEGEITYTATVTFEGNTYTNVKKVAQPKKHKLERVEKVYPTEDRHGNIEYWRCPDCGKLFSDENGEHEITQADTVLPLFTFCEDDGHIKLISYNGNDENVIVPDKVPDDYPDESLCGEDFSIIKEEAFKGNSTIRNVIMQNNIAHIGDSAFRDCENLTEITVGTNLDYIGKYCFFHSPKLKKITIYSKDSRFSLHNLAFDGAAGDITVYGYRNTKVEEMVEAANRRFVPLDPAEIQNVTYSVDKTWDIDFAGMDKPGSIQVVLQRKKSARSWETLQLVTLDDANNHWKAEFAPVPSAYYDEEDERFIEYEYRIRELGPKKAEDAELDPNADDFQEKVKDRLIYDTWDFDRPIITQIINNAKNPEVIWQFEPNVDWIKNLAKTTVVSPPFVMFDIDGYFDGVKNIPKHTTKYMVTYESDDEYPDKTNITNLAVLDTTVYKRWLNFEESEKPESVYLMLESKVQTEYAAANNLTKQNFYTPSFDAVVGSLNLTDIPISGDTIRNRVNEGISKNLGGPLSALVTTGTDALFNNYFATGLTVGKATPDSQNPLTRWRVKFTVKKYGMGEKRLPMDYAGAELVTGMMEMIIDALIHEAELDFSVPVMYEPFGKYWSIKGYALSLIHDYERTCNVINVKFHSDDGDPDDPNNRAQVIGGTKYWKDDDAPDRPESINLHVYYKDDDGVEQEVQGMPVTVTNGDSNGENGWTWMLKIPADSPDRYKNYYIREDLPEGYEASYMGLDLIDSKSQTEPTTEEPTTEEPTSEVTETTVEPSTVVTEPTEEPSTVVTEPTEEPTTEVTEPTEEPTTVVTEPPEEESTQKTEPKTDTDDDDDDDDDDPGVPIVVPVPVDVPPVVPDPGGPGGPDDPEKPTESTEATEATEETETTEETEPTEPDTLVVTKVWIDDTEDVRPSYIKIHIYNAGVEIAGSPVKLSKSNFAGSFTWISKPIKLSEGVNKNTLTYSETYPSGYQNRDNYASVVFGSTIFNTWLQTNITGTKTWVDGGNILNKRPDEITVNLLEDGTKVESVKTNASKGWKYSFVNKPIFKTVDGTKVKINYTVEEEAVNDYVTTYDGYDITNTLSNSVTAKGCYKFKYTDRYGGERIKTVEVDLNNQEILGYSGNNNQPGVPTYLWTEEAQKLFDKNPLVTAALAVTGNKEEPQKDVSVYKNDIEWELIKFTADDATNMTPDPSGKSLTVLAQTKPHTFTFYYYFVKDGNVEYRGMRTEIPYGKPVTFSPEFTDPEKYVHIDQEIPQENFCYWSADEEGLIPITTNRTFGMLMKGKWDETDDSDRVVNVYAQYSNNLTYDWMPLIEEATFTHMIDDDYNWVYLDYMTNYLSKDGTVVKNLVAQGDENIRYGLIAVKHPYDSSEISRDLMIELTQSMIADDSAAVYTDNTKQSIAYRFEYGKQGDTVKPITNFNRALYTLQTDTENAQNMQFSVMAYITVDGTNYFYSKVNNDINVHELLSE